MNNGIIAAVIALAVGGVGGYLSGKNSVSPAPTSSASNMQMSTTTVVQNGMEAMVSNLQSTSGDDFDRAFIDGMIMHHETAVRMAEMALQSAQRPELKQMAQEIITAQNKEISQLQQWREQWFGR